MREGMRALGDMLGQGERSAEGETGQQPGDQPGDGAREGQANAPYDRRADRDPLGRQVTDNNGMGGAAIGGDPLADGGGPAARARDLLDEIRRRSGERGRPEDERDYLGRLLDRF